MTSHENDRASREKESGDRSPHSTAARAVVLTFDRLPARFLGCYGNEDAATPAFDWLAAESVVFDFHYCEHAAAEAPGHAWWTGRHHFPHPREVQRGFPSLTCSLAAAGGRTILVSERDAAPLAPPFGETIEVGGREGLSVEADETPFARLIDAAEEQLAGLVVSESRPWLLWLRSRGVPVPWVPPPEFLVEQMLQAGGPEAFESDDEELEEPPEALPGKPPGNGNPAGDGAGGIAAALLEALATPAMLRATRKDPDLFLQAAEASRFLYSACVRMLDRELGRLRTAIEHACGEGPLLFIVTAALGQSLGETVLRTERPSELERGSRLVEEFTHTPLLIQLRPGTIPGRARELVQTVDIGPTLLDWFGVPAADMRLDGRSLLPIVRAESSTGREFICLGDGARQRAIRTEDFLLVTDEPPADGQPADPPRLYVQPDDRWQVNDVAGQSPDAVGRLEGLLEGFLRSQAAAGK